MNPDGYSPPVQPHHINRTLIDAVHHAMVHHPDAQRTSEYAKMLATLTAIQAREAAGAQQAGGPALSPGAEAVGPQTGYVDRNLTPLQQLLVAGGGIANMHPAAFGPAGAAGGLAGLLAGVGHPAGLVPTQAWT